MARSKRSSQMNKKTNARMGTYLRGPQQTEPKAKLPGRSIQNRLVVGHRLVPDLATTGRSDCQTHYELDIQSRVHLIARNARDRSLFLIPLFSSQVPLMLPPSNLSSERLGYLGSTSPRPPLIHKSHLDGYPAALGSKKATPIQPNRCSIPYTKSRFTTLVSQHVFLVPDRHSAVWRKIRLTGMLVDTLISAFDYIDSGRLDPWLSYSEW